MACLTYVFTFFLDFSISDPNCEARKWTVLGEIRVGVFASKDINDGEELTWDYNFEWFGGEKVECKCGAESCVGFLGAKSRAFKVRKDKKSSFKKPLILVLWIFSGIFGKWRSNEGWVGFFCFFGAFSATPLGIVLHFLNFEQN